MHRLRRTALVLMLFPCCVGAEEAVTHEGRRHVGTLRSNGFLVSATETLLSLGKLRLVAFPEFPAPLPRCRLLHQILLSDAQRLTGELLSLGPRDARFRLSTGEAVTMARRHLEGIVQTDGRLTVWAEYFDDKMSGAS